EEELRVVDDGLGQLDPLLHARGVGLDLEVALVLEAAQVERRVGAFHGGGAGEAAELAGVGAQLDGGHAGEVALHLRHVAAAVADRERVAARVEPEDARFALERREPEEELEQGRFAGAVGAEQADAAAGDADLAREPAQRRDLPVPLRDVGQLEQHSGGWYDRVPPAPRGAACGGIRCRFPAAGGKLAAVRVRVRLLGGFVVEQDGVPIPAGAWDRRRPADVLKVVGSARGGRLHREQAIDALWPDKEPATGANNLYRALHDLRRIVGAEVVVLDKGVLHLAPGVAVAPEAGLDASDPDRRGAAPALYAGARCPDAPYAEPLAARRDMLRRRFVDAALAAARRAGGRGDETRALELLRRVLATSAE